MVARGRSLLFILTAGILIVGALAVAGVVAFVAINNAVEQSGEPVEWGTFTEHELVCHEARRVDSCLSRGSWVSDDGSRVVKSIDLDARIGSGESIRAGFQPEGFGNSIETGTVQTESWMGSFSTIWTLVFGAIALGLVSAGPALWKRWRRSRTRAEF
ncbi:hypothetical protein [Mycetocola saprophilus]|uniref:hypothetical protein n=1 Tax=Mycetocola saprophilus TaxID=76636 RepID=UPI003BF37E62